ncbi:uncharacterized protein BO97DRAFT_165960 [Aspergillus homomorphus CBS 101889]|uniref:Uncharacterized protein n=1 Tax=Aspergillus homomorphus (strain CBS 101889) TaxID=1450537 RepID=A0A395HQ09_ASPHC|nr:hypothetical protein BO97DRAFT_165960 [Aspergillus homomorphus CBS 101889]RAL09523.1 hypothetical protein BO97DRAFT_165960 [Aspergillus homomorphus CBS 101889]
MAPVLARVRSRRSPGITLGCEETSCHSSFPPRRPSSHSAELPGTVSRQRPNPILETRAGLRGPIPASFPRKTSGGCSGPPQNRSWEGWIVHDRKQENIQWWQERRGSSSFPREEETTFRSRLQTGSGIHAYEKKLCRLVGNSLTKQNTNRKSHKRSKYRTPHHAWDGFKPYV